MTDSAPDETTTIRIEPAKPPWLYRPLAMIAVMCLVVTLLLFAVSSILGNVAARNERDDLKQRVAVAAAKSAARDALEQAQQDCRDDRVDQVLILTSRLVGNTAELFGALAARADLPQMQPIIDRGVALSHERALADESLGRALEECRG